MDISRHIKEFAGKNHRYKPYSKICRKMLLGGMPYSLNSQKGYEESEYLPYNIRSCVQAYASTKDTAIELFKDLVLYLEAESVDVPQIDFPPIPVSNTFERLMFIAKYLQEKENRISELTDILWVNPRTIEEDLSRLRGINDPIQVCGKAFYIPDTVRQDGRITFSSDFSCRKSHPGIDYFKGSEGDVRESYVQALRDAVSTGDLGAAFTICEGKDLLCAQEFTS